jgi:hypothetical protein
MISTTLWNTLLPIPASVNENASNKQTNKHAVTFTHVLKSI